VISRKQEKLIYFQFRKLQKCKEYSAVGAGDAVAPPSNFLGRQNLLDLSEIWAKLRRNLGKNEANLGKGD